MSTSSSASAVLPSTTTPHASLAGGFHHVALRLNNWDAALAFYRDVLGFREHVAWSRPNGLRCVLLDIGGNCRLEVFEDPAAQPIASADATGPLLHLALHAVDVDEAVARVRAAGYPVTRGPEDVTIKSTNGIGPVPVRLAFFDGPAGEVWELFKSDRA
ncbi:VOC family protein [Geminisphaera colitermitum]|uniref:VOC family protein n=1 Tax=Geminisphaera colitermitum TaxID=1148786 RepID=UPI000158D41B|nr:VOC family protein [Geminisphaera colitermitum]